MKKLSLAQHDNHKITKAIAEFDLIKEGDRIVVGLSGGKDSAFLLYALAVLKKSLTINFDLAALTIDFGFAGVDFSPLEKYCQGLGVAYCLEKTRISQYILAEKRKNPCAKCAHFRRGAIVGFMKEKGFNKLAYGHHYDDVVETFLMNIIYSGQLKTFQPRQYLSRNDIYIIRPLVYLREKEIIEAVSFIGYKPLLGFCPYDGKTKREEVKRLIKGLGSDKQIFNNLVAAMREGTSLDLWPEELPKKELTERMKRLWK